VEFIINPILAAVSSGSAFVTGLVCVVEVGTGLIPFSCFPDPAYTSCPLWDSDSPSEPSVLRVGFTDNPFLPTVFEFSNSKTIIQQSAPAQFSDDIVHLAGRLVVSLSL
jgi:hypothetical protein